MGIAEKAIANTTLAVVDLETTGLYPEGDRVVEVAVVRMEPGRAPALVLDTLINPQRRVSGTEIHGITDADVRDAPRFQDVAGSIIEALAGCVFASYNVYFDSKFMQGEFLRVGVPTFPPHLCLMYMRPMLGLGNRCTLEDACRAHGVQQAVAHHAGADALAAAYLWTAYLATLQKKGVRTFGDLAKLKSYKFIESFSTDPLTALFPGLGKAAKFKPRGPVPSVAAAPVPSAASSIGSEATWADRTASLAEYWDALTAVLADLAVSRDEVTYLTKKRKDLALTVDEVRWLHGRAYAGVLADICLDKAISDGEANALAELTSALRMLGWAPGDPTLT